MLTVLTQNFRSCAVFCRRRYQPRRPPLATPQLANARRRLHHARPSRLPSSNATAAESSVEQALIELYLAGISVRRVEDITEALWSTRVSPSTVSNLNKKIYAKIEACRNRRIENEHPYLYLDGIVMKRTWPARFAISRSCWPVPSILKVFGRSGHLRERQRTNPAPRRFCVT